jgi:hypothetical protein
MTTTIRVPNNLLDDKGKLTPKAICAMYRITQSKDNDYLNQDQADNICAKAVKNSNSRSPFQCQSRVDWGPFGSAKTAVACGNTNTGDPTCDPSGMCVPISGKAGKFTGGYSYDNMPGFQQKNDNYWGCNSGNWTSDAKVVLTGLVNEDPHSKYVDCNYTLKDEDIKKMSSEDMAVYSKIYDDCCKGVDPDTQKCLQLPKDERSNGYYIDPTDEKKGSWQSGNRQLLSTWCWTRDENNSNPSNQALPRVLTESTICKPLTRNNDLFKKEVASWCQKCNDYIDDFKKKCREQGIKCTINNFCPECGCFNDLSDPGVRSAIGTLENHFHNDAGEPGDSSCYWNRCSDASKNLQPEQKKKCSTKVPKCEQIVNLVGVKVPNITQNINCDSSPSPSPDPNKPKPKPNPLTNVWDKIKNFLKRINPKVFIAPAAILVIAIVVGIFGKRKGNKSVSR